MPNALVHSLFAALLSFVIIAFLPIGPWDKVMCGVVALAFSFLPDIDHPRAVARQVYRKAGTLLLAILLFIFLQGYVGVVWAVAISIILSLLFISASERMIPHHRGLTHRLGFGILFSLAFYFILVLLDVSKAVYFALSGLIGYVSHLFLDKVF